jgi:streptogramin lyase
VPATKRRMLVLVATAFLASMAVPRATASTAAGRLTVFPLPGFRSPAQIAMGLDGNIWFDDGGYLGRMTPDGTLTEFPVPIITQSIGIAPDGSIWFGSASNRQIGFLRPNGSHELFALDHYSPDAITAGPDGNMWVSAEGFREDNRIYQLDLSGNILQSFQVTGSPGTILTGPDGNLWFVSGKADRPHDDVR